MFYINLIVYYFAIVNFVFFSDFWHKKANEND